MNERVAALVGLGALVGALGPIVNRRGPEWLRRRAIGVALAGALAILTFHSPLGRGVTLLLAVAVLAAPDAAGREHPLGRLVVPLVLASLAGVWVTVPDVEPSLVIAGSLIPLAVVHLARGRGPGPTGTAVLVATVMWTVVVGAAGRAPAFAAAACVGMVAVAPLVLGWGNGPLSRWWTAVLFGAHLGLAVPVGRLAMGLEAPVALSLAVVSVALQLAIAVAVRRSVPSRRPVR